MSRVTKSEYPLLALASMTARRCPLVGAILAPAIVRMSAQCCEGLGMGNATCHQHAKAIII
jgi:hypothetical protein